MIHKEEFIKDLCSWELIGTKKRHLIRIEPECSFTYLPISLYRFFGERCGVDKFEMSVQSKIIRFYLILILALSIGACSNVEGQSAEPQDTVEPDRVEESAEPDEALPSLMEYESGVEGYLWIGPMCPVVHEGTECPDQPYETEFTITDLEGEKVVVGKSDADGFFRIYLYAGSYVLVPESGKPGVVPSAEPIPFNVEPDTFTFLEITFDSGIR
jgi:hypothetical protein